MLLAIAEKRIVVSLAYDSTGLKHFRGCWKRIGILTVGDDRLGRDPSGDGRIGMVTVVNKMKWGHCWR